MTEWDEANWQEIFDSVKVDWCIVLGQPLSGKTTLAQTMKKTLGSQRVTQVDWREIEQQIKNSLGTPEEPFEGKVPLLKVEEQIIAVINRDKKAGKRVTYVFDGFPGQQNYEEFARFAQDKLRCPPDHVI